MDYVHNFWIFVAYGVGTVAFQALLAASWMVLGGMGATWRTNQALARFTDEIGRIDQRVTREVKTRAGQEGAAAKKAQNGPSENLQAEAARRLAEVPKQEERPSVAGYLRNEENAA